MGVQKYYQPADELINHGFSVDERHGVGLRNEVRYIYFVRAGELTKIGHAKYLKERMRDIQRKTEDDIELMIAFPSQNVDGVWHNYFFDKWDHREWFRLDTQDYLDVLQLIADGVNVADLGDGNHFRHLRLKVPAKLYNRLDWIRVRNDLAWGQMITELILEALDARERACLLEQQAQGA